MKKILIPNGSFHDIPLIKRAKKMGYYVITSGAAPGGIGHRYADEYVYGDFSDKEKMLEIAEEKKIDMICSNCNDFGYLSACYVAEKLKLPGHESYEKAVQIHHKDAFKRLAEKLGLSTPSAESFSGMEEAKAYLDSAKYPVIIKPVDLGAGQGITRADTFEEATRAVGEALLLSKAKQIVIEPFIEGTNHSFNAFIVDGKVRSYYSDNEYMKYSRYRVSTSAGPADKIEEAIITLIRDTEVTAQALDLPDGLMHSQYIMDREGTPHIIEITRRMSGDWYPCPEMRATGIDWVEYFLKAQMGDNVSDFPQNVIQKGNTGRHCLNCRVKGIVRNVQFKPDLEKYIYDSVLWMEEGFKIENLEKDYPGIIFFDFDDREKMMHVLGKIDDYIEFEYA